jgi:hypothetical protein
MVLIRFAAATITIALTRCDVVLVRSRAGGHERAGSSSGHGRRSRARQDSGDPIIEAGVEVVGKGKTVRTDLDGKFTLKLEPGTYEIRVFAPAFQSVRVPRVTVKPNEVSKVDVSLAAAGKAGVDVVEVVAQANRAAEATQLVQRKKAAVVSDTISSEVMKKTPGSDAADVIQRAPAVTVKDEKFIFVRGLGERYSSAMLNGSRLPSTDPQKRVVPLDLFPADFLESLSIIKSYTPDLPGDFSGGLADLHLRDFPESLSGSLGVASAAIPRLRSRTSTPTTAPAIWTISERAKASGQFQTTCQRTRARPATRSDSGSAGAFETSGKRRRKTRRPTSGATSLWEQRTRNSGSS